jgi:hypothetical protein
MNMQRTMIGNDHREEKKTRRLCQTREKVMGMKQRQAVYNAVTSALKEKGVKFEDGMNASQHITDEMRKSIVAVLVSGFTKGEIELSNPQGEKLPSYCSGLLNNWLRKDTKLNGGTKYTPANPGSRAGQGDEVIKEMRKLLKTNAGDAAATAKIQACIEARASQIKSVKAKKEIVIDADKLPAELRDLVK